MLSKFEYDGKLNPNFKTGSFQLPLSCIWGYAKQPQTPQFVLVSSAGVTRPDRYRNHTFWWHQTALLSTLAVMLSRQL